MPTEPDQVANLPAKAREYILDVQRAAAELEISVLSLILFGSLAKGGFSHQVSDVDLIVVVEDDSTARQVKDLRKAITGLEYSHGFRVKHSSLIDFAYRVSERLTGMFISNFVVSARDLRSGCFHRIFQLSRFMSALLAPSSIVMGSVFTSASTIWGNDLIGEIPLCPITKGQVRKSRWMTWLLNMGAFVTYPVHPHATKFSMEAFKWAIHCSYFCHMRRSASVEESIDYLQSRYELDGFEEFLELRAEYRRSFNFVWHTFRMLKTIHRLDLRNLAFPIEVTRGQPGDAIGQKANR